MRGAERIRLKRVTGIRTYNRGIDVSFRAIEATAPTGSAGSNNAQATLTRQPVKTGSPPNSPLFPAASRLLYPV